VLAWIFLKERLSRNQWIGIAAALIAIALMSFDWQTFIQNMGRNLGG
jgi:drug/metabolite transporter (DMT)-like permease